MRISGNWVADSQQQQEKKEKIIECIAILEHPRCTCVNCTCPLHGQQQHQSRTSRIDNAGQPLICDVLMRHVCWIASQVGASSMTRWKAKGFFKIWKWCCYSSYLIYKGQMLYRINKALSFWTSWAPQTWDSSHLHTPAVKWRQEEEKRGGDGI